MLSDHIKQDINLAFQTGGCILLHGLSALLSCSNKQPLVNSDSCHLNGVSLKTGLTVNEPQSMVTKNLADVVFGEIF